MDRVMNGESLVAPEPEKEYTPEELEEIRIKVEEVGGPGLSDMMMHSKDGPEHAEAWDAAFWSLAGILSKTHGKNTARIVFGVLKELDLLDV